MPLVWIAGVFFELSSNGIKMRDVGVAFAALLNLFGAVPFLLALSALFPMGFPFRVYFALRSATEQNLCEHEK